MRRPWVAVLVILVLGLGVAGAAFGEEAKDPEPWTNPNQEYHFDKGPGWPEGWTEPPVPTEIPQAAKDDFEDLVEIPDPANPERMELRVWLPLPEWTREYPYYWQYRPLICGKTMYVMMFPYPDTGLIFRTFDESYSVSGGPTGGNCLFTPITGISYTPKETPEQREQRLLAGDVGVGVGLAMGDLDDCRSDRENGTLDNIFLCFNSGNGTAKLDVPAYLDTTVNRVRVPIRFVSERMGGRVDWNQETQTVSIYFPPISREIVKPVTNPGYTPADWWTPDTYDLDSDTYKWARVTVSQPERTIVMTVGSNRVLVDGVEKSLDAPPVVVQGRTMVPLRFVAEALGAKVYWVGKDPVFKKPDGTLGGTYQVHIYTPLWTWFENPSWFLENRAMKQ